MESYFFQIYVFSNIYLFQHIYIYFALICISFFLTQLNSNPIEFELNPMYLNSIQVAKCGKNGPNWFIRFFLKKKNLPDFYNSVQQVAKIWNYSFKKKNYFHVFVNMVGLYHNILVDLAHECQIINFNFYFLV